MADDGTAYLTGVPELASLAVYVLGSLFPEPAPPGSTATRPNPPANPNNNKPFAHSLPSPPPDTPPASPVADHFVDSHASPPPAPLSRATGPAHVAARTSGAGPSACTADPARSGARAQSAPMERQASPPSVSLYQFVEYTLIRTRLAIPTFHKSLILLTKLKSRYPRASGTSLAGHRLFVAAAMLACGMDMDDAYRRSSWVEVCRGLFTSRQLSQMETEMLAFLGFSAHVRDAELASWMRLFVLPYCVANQVLAPLGGFGHSAAQAVAFATAPSASAADAQPSWLVGATTSSKPFGATEVPPSPPASPNRGQHEGVHGTPPSPKLVAWQHSAAAASPEAKFFI